MKNRQNLVLIIAAFLLAVMLISGCEMNKLNNAEALYRQKSYVGAIEAADQLIRTANNGAIATRAEILRGDSYLALGMMALERDNRPLAIRFLKLANSPDADHELASLYYRMGEEVYEEGDLVKAMSYMQDILREIPETELMPMVAYRRINIFVDEYKDYDAAYEEYKALYDNYPDHEYELLAREEVKKFIDMRVEYATRLLNGGYYTDSFRELFELSQYPVVEIGVVNALIGDVYMAQGEQFVQEEDYIEADRLYRIAVQYNPHKEGEVKSRLEGIIGLYITKGNELMGERRFDEARLHYNKSFDIIPDYEPANLALAALDKRESDIARAIELVEEAEEYERKGQIADALRLYNQAIALDALPIYQERARLAQNMVEAERDPLAFAQRILYSHRNGIIPRRVEEKRQDILKEYKSNEIRDSGWKFLLSSGQYKFEARYDLLTPVTTFLYVWQINLRDRSIIPLNKQSEEMMN
ncbi:MAG TPA: hypothetical protein GXX77_02435 [Candidatus Cloacimonetes bacterium]|nr:hypothetical protein [Candidatus Cloacimonadota bacterium]